MVDSFKAYVYIVLFASCICSAAIFVELSAVNVLWILAARAICDSLLSTLALIITRCCWSSSSLSKGRDEEDPSKSKEVPEDEHEEPPALFFAWDDLSLYLRATCYFFFMLGWYLSLSYLPVGIAIALMYSNPAITVPLCAVVLGESIPNSFWVLFTMMFTGVLLIAEPWNLSTASDDETASGYSLGLVFALGSVLSLAVVTMLTRRGFALRQQHVFHVQQASGFVACGLVPLSFLAVYACSGGDASALPAAPWQTGELPNLFLIGMLAFAALCFWKLAHDNASNAALVALVQSIEVPMGVAAQFLIFKDKVNVTDWAGMVLILLASILNKAPQCVSATACYPLRSIDIESIWCYPLPLSQCDRAGCTRTHYDNAVLDTDLKDPLMSLPDVLALSRERRQPLLPVVG